MNYKYYSTQRPLEPGAFPRSDGNRVERIENFPFRVHVAEIDRLAWGCIEYERPLAAEEAAAYELVPAERRAVQR